MRRSFSAVTIWSVARILARRIASRSNIRLIGQERARTLFLGAVERFLGARKHLMHIGGMARRGDAADRARDGDRPGGSHHHVVADGARESARRRRRFPPACSSLRMTPNLLPAEAAKTILRAHAAAQPLGDDADHLVGDIVAVGLVDDAPDCRSPPAEIRRMSLYARRRCKVCSSCSVKCQRLISPVCASKRDR